jgi:hypothetical protein
MPLATETITSPVADDGKSWIFVWGLVCYDDGFDEPRKTEFCHRYNRGALKKGAHVRHRIRAKDGRYHKTGNYAD